MELLDDTVRPNKIALVGHSRYEEGRAAGTITPGHIIARNGDGEYVVQATDALDVEMLVAIEDSLQGHTIDDDYSDGDLVRFVCLKPGDVFFGWLESGQNVSNGDDLELAAGGELQAVGSGAVKAIALEDCNASAAATRIRCRTV